MDVIFLVWAEMSSSIDDCEALQYSLQPRGWPRILEFQGSLNLEAGLSPFPQTGSEIETQPFGDLSHCCFL